MRITTKDAALDRLVETLFTNGVGQKANRLVLVAEEGAGGAKVTNARDLGGWGKQFIRDRINEYLDQLDGQRMIIVGGTKLPPLKTPETIVDEIFAGILGHAEAVGAIQQIQSQLAQVTQERDEARAENERLASQLKEWQEEKDTKAGYL